MAADIVVKFDVWIRGQFGYKSTIAEDRNAQQRRSLQLWRIVEKARDLPSGFGAVDVFDGPQAGAVRGTVNDKRLHV